MNNKKLEFEKMCEELPGFQKLYESLNSQNFKIIAYQSIAISVLLKKINGKINFSDEDRIALSSAAKNINPDTLEKLNNIAKPETMMKWYRNLVNRKWDFSHKITKPNPGRPRKSLELENLIVKIAMENKIGVKKILGELKKLWPDVVNKQYVKRILKKNGIPIRPNGFDISVFNKFIKDHMRNTWACDFFTEEIVEANTMTTNYTLFFIHHESRLVKIMGSTKNPNNDWVCQQAKNFLYDVDGFPVNPKYLIHDNDGAFTKQFDAIFKSQDMQIVKIPPHSPDCNAFAERWIRSIREESLDKFPIFGFDNLRLTLKEYEDYYNNYRPHQGIDNNIPKNIYFKITPEKIDINKKRKLKSKSFIGGTIKHYFWKYYDKKVS